jgi:putative transposase
MREAKALPYHWLSRCIVLDLYSGRVVGWSMSPRQDRQLVVQAVLMAVWQRPERTPVILHSDRGCQLTSDEYPHFLAARADIFDYIERWHNPRQRRRLTFQHQGEQRSSHLSVEMG